MHRGGRRPSVSSGQPFDIEVFGNAGETIYALLGEDLGFYQLNTFAGAIQVEGVLGRRRLGALPPGGIRTVTFTAPSVPAGSIRSLAFQFVLSSPNGSVRLAPADIIDVAGPGVPLW